MRVVAVLFGGILYALALPPTDWAFCGWVALTPLLLAVRGQSIGAAFRYGCLFGYAVGWGVLWPLVEAATGYLNVSETLATAGVTLWFLVVVGAPCGCFAAAATVALRHTRGAATPIMVGALWVTSELLRGRVLGQPWGLLGYTQHTNLPLIQIAAFGGVYGVSFLLAMTGSTIADALLALRGSLPANRLRVRVMTPAALLAASWLGGWTAVRSAPEPGQGAHEVAIVQTNVVPPREWTPSYTGAQVAAHVRATDELYGKADPALIVWPEYAVPAHVDADPGLASVLGRVARKHGADLVFGTPRTDGDRHFNSLRLVKSDGTSGGHYDKRRLVLFAEEATPFGTSPAFSSGTRGGVLSAFTTLGVSICHEVLHPDLIIDSVRDGARILVNVANDSWLGRSSEAAGLQHAAMARFRAVETRRFLVRAATTGPSAIFDPFGRSLVMLPPKERGVAVAKVAPMSTQSWYVLAGDVFGVACVLVALVGVGLGLLHAAGRPEPALGA